MKIDVGLVEVRLGGAGDVVGIVFTLQTMLSVCVEAQRTSAPVPRSAERGELSPMKQRQISREA
jgi:hypothetical protein